MCEDPFFFSRRVVIVVALNDHVLICDTFYTRFNIFFFSSPFPLFRPAQLETTETDDLTAAFLDSELYPKSAEKTAFAKPARPGRGRARMIGGGAAHASAAGGDDE